jgi:hypothetical protein
MATSPRGDVRLQDAHNPAGAASTAWLQLARQTLAARGGWACLVIAWRFALRLYSVLSSAYTMPTSNPLERANVGFDVFKSIVTLSWPPYLLSPLAAGAPRVVPSADQWISGGRCSHGGAETRRKQREDTATGHKGNWRAPCSCLCVKHTRGCPQVFCTAPVIHPVRVHTYPWQAS